MAESCTISPMPLLSKYCFGKYHWTLNIGPTNRNVQQALTLHKVISTIFVPSLLTDLQQRGA
jgi:hypothetical protein